MKIKNKRNLIIILGILFLGIGSTLAFFKNSTILDNIFNSGRYKTITHEEFVSPSNWMPGDTTEKTVTVKNEGSKLVNVRMCIDDYWVAVNDDELPNHSNALNMDIAVINLDNISDWTYLNGCYYYNDALEPNETTSSPIQSVTFNPNYEGTIICYNDQTTGNRVCESTDNSYDNGVYHLNITIETIQTEGLGEWDLGYSIGGNKSYGSAAEVTEDSGFNTFIKSYISNGQIKKDSGFIYEDEEIYIDYSSDYETNKDLLLNKFGSNYCNESNDQSWGKSIICKNDNYTISLTHGYNSYELIDHLGISYAYLDSIYIENYNGSNRLSCINNEYYSNCFTLSGNTLMVNQDSNNYFLGKTLDKSEFESIEIVDHINIPNDAIDSWDVGTFQNGEVMAWYTDADFNEAYELYIGQDGGVIANPDSSFAFSSFNNIGLLKMGDFNTSNVINMSSMFAFSKFIEDLDQFDVSNVAMMSAMFHHSVISNFGDLSNWDTSNVKNMSAMFESSLISNLGDLSNWDTSNVTNMSAMFYFSAISNFGDLSNWNTSNVTDMKYMFSYVGDYATTFDISFIENWDTSKVTDMSHMFDRVGYSATTWSIGDLSNWDTSNVTSMTEMFSNAGYNATSFDISFIENWDTSKVTNMNNMFNNAGYNAITWDIGDLSNWNTSNVTYMEYMFSNAGYSATTWSIGDLSNWDTSNVTYMSGMFSNAGYNATSFDISFIENWDTSNVNSMSSMFSNAGYSATTWSIGDLSNWDTSKVTDMSSMFYNAGYNATTWNIGNLSDWNTSNVTSMGSMFSSAGHSATTWNIGNLSDWNTSNVTSMSYMFSQAGYNATTWNIGNLSDWNTSNVTSMSYMFSQAGYNATTWSIGDLSNWDTSKVKYMDAMFSGAGYNATTWNSIGTLKVYANDITNLFYNCRNAKVTLNLYTNPSSKYYKNIFTNAATTSGSLITVNYSSAVTNIDNIIATKSNNSNVVKGNQLD